MMFCGFFHDQIKGNGKHYAASGKGAAQLKEYKP
jgi:hypothetical protein